MQLLLAGATGLVGSHVVELALAEPRIEMVIALTRRPIDPRGKLTYIQVDFDRLDENADYWRCDAAISTLGTTQNDAGSREAFYKIDHDYSVGFATLARARGVSRFGLNSSLGADRNSSIYYLRVKGEIERDVEALAFPSLTVVRPSLLGGQRSVDRRGEHIGAVAMALAAPLLPAWLRISQPLEVAKVLLDGVLAGEPGQRVRYTGGAEA